MKNQIWKKWMAGVLTASVLFAHPFLTFADDPSVSASSAGTVTSSSATGEGEELSEEDSGTDPEKDPSGDETGEETKSDEGTKQEPGEDDSKKDQPTETPAPTPIEPQKTPSGKTGIASGAEKDKEEEQREQDPDSKKEQDQKDNKAKNPEKEAVQKDNAVPEVPHQATNEELIAAQEIVHAPVILKDFRFWTVNRKFAFARKDHAAILEEMKEDARVVGTLPKEGLCYVLQETEEEDSTVWLYVESGDVRGFIRRKDVYTGEQAKRVLEQYRGQAGTGSTIEDASEQAPLASAEVDPVENEAYTFLRATARQTVIQKDYAIANVRVCIREEADKDGRVVGIMDKGDLCYVVADRDAEWVYVESGNVRGFVMAEDLEMDPAPYQSAQQYQEIQTSFDAAEEEAKAISAKNKDAENEDAREADEKAASDAGVAEPKEETKEEKLAKINKKKYPVYYEVMEKGEGSFDTAEQKVEPEDNHACYYTLTSPKPGTPGGKIRESLLTFAAQFVGNPYVWGGTSLTAGADCSGFVQSVYAQYGYELPRTSGEQSQYGTKIPVEEAEPGDLIFYADGGEVYHVVIYAGDGNTIEAMNESAGIRYGHVLASDAVWATRVLEDEYEEVFNFSGDIGEQNASKDMYGEDLGEFTITYYCPCAECNGGYSGTSTGAPLVQGRTIAVDPTVIPYGTKVIIGGHVFTAEDCGGAIKGNRIDIFVNEHEMCNALGVRGAHVYLVK